MTESAYIEQLEAEKKELIEILSAILVDLDQCGVSCDELEGYWEGDARVILAKYQPAATETP